MLTYFKFQNDICIINSTFKMIDFKLGSKQIAFFNFQCSQAIDVSICIFNNRKFI